MKKTVFYLLPTPLKPNGWDTIPDYAIQMYHKLDYFIAENPKTARRFLNQIQHPLPQNEIVVEKYDKKSTLIDVDRVMNPLRDKKSIGYLSEAGSAAIADPGNQLVLWAHRHDIPVHPFPAPISLMLALAGSGLNGQNFHFHGYLPIKRKAFQIAVKDFQSTSVKYKTTHIFIETPYRSQKTMMSLLNTLHNDILLCLAKNLTTESQLIKTLPVGKWKQIPPQIEKEDLCVFLIGVES